MDEIKLDAYFVALGIHSILIREHQVMIGIYY